MRIFGNLFSQTQPGQRLEQQMAVVGKHEDAIKSSISKIRTIQEKRSHYGEKQTVANVAFFTASAGYGAALLGAVATGGGFEPYVNGLMAAGGNLSADVLGGTGAAVIIAAVNKARLYLQNEFGQKVETVLRSKVTAAHRELSRLTPDHSIYNPLPTFGQAAPAAEFKGNEEDWLPTPG